MLTPRSARARKHLPRAPGLSSIVTVNSFAFGMDATLLAAFQKQNARIGWPSASHVARPTEGASTHRRFRSFIYPLVPPEHRIVYIIAHTGRDRPRPRGPQQ